MSKRPLSITIIGCLFIVTGGVGLAYHFTEINIQHPFEGDSFWICWICFVRFLAVPSVVMADKNVRPPLRITRHALPSRHA